MTRSEAERLNIGPKEIWAQDEPPPALVWAVCPWVEGRNFKKCNYCPVWEDSDCGKVQRGCYGLASEVCRVVAAATAALARANALAAPEPHNED